MELLIFSDAIEILSFIVEIVGSVLILYGGLSATYKILLGEFLKKPSDSFKQIRCEFTSKIVFGLGRHPPRNTVRPVPAAFL